MSNLLPQTNSEPYYLLQNLTGLLPNLEKAIIIYRKEKGNTLGVMIKNMDDSAPIEMEINEYFNPYGLEKLVEGKSHYQWIDESSVPFLQKTTSLIQKDVFSEANNSILLLRIRNRNTNSNDVFLIFFNSKATNFGPVRNTEILNTTSKSIIDQLIYSYLQQIKKQFSDQQNQFIQYRKFLGRLKDKAGLHAAKNKNTLSDLEKMRLDFVDYIIKRISKAKNIDIAMSSGALEIASRYEGGFAKMERWIEEAFEFAQFTDYEEAKPVLVIDEWHLGDPEFEDQNQMETEWVDTKYMKVYSLLDRLEAAALRVAGERKNLTGSYVGQAMDTPISAPAITDALRKNNSKIKYLMNQFPQRWTLIRSEFRPIVNVLVNRTDHKQQQAS